MEHARPVLPKAREPRPAPHATPAVHASSARTPAAQTLQATLGNAEVARRASEGAPPPPVRAAHATAGNAAITRAAKPRKETAGVSVFATAKSGDEIMAGLEQTTPSHAIQGVADARRATVRAIDAEHRELAAHAPSLERPSGLPRKGEAKPVGTGVGKPAEKAKRVASPTENPAPLRLEQRSLAPPPLVLPPMFLGRIDAATDDSPALRTHAEEALEAVATEDTTVETDPGAPPPVALQGDADPAQIDKQVSTQAGALETEWSHARTAMAEEEGENDVFPDVPHEKLKAHVHRHGAGGARHAPRKLEQLPPEALAAFDAAAGGKWNDGLAQAHAEHESGKQKRESDEGAARASANTEIKRLEAEAATDQTAAQDHAKEDAARARGEWNASLAQGQKQYDEKTTRAVSDARSNIAREQTKAQKDIDEQYKQAREEAAQKKREAEEEAAEKKREAQEDSGGFWGWVKSGIKRAISALKSAIGAIFDALRAAVRFIIDKVKRLALWIIDRVRALVVGFLHVCGELLCLAADVFLGMFPGLRDRAKRAIRKGVARAEDAVNRAADWLKGAVSKVLDALGDALDFILSVYQKVIDKILDVIEFIAVGLIEIVQGIGRLASAAWDVGDYFVGQIEEEGIGVDLTQPLPIEKPRAEASNATLAATAVAAGRLDAADAGVLTKPTLAESDVTVDPVAELKLEPGLLKSLPPLAEGGEYRFGDNEAPENQREALMGETLASELAPPTAAAAAPGDGAEPMQAKGATPDVASMTPDQQLEYLDQQEMPHTCGEKKEEPAKEGAVPEHLRIYGPFTAGQRFKYMWGQIKKGISQWWSCNKVKIIAAFAIAALVALLLGILTGGAIFAAIPPLLELVGTLLVGAAVVKATDYIGGYLKLAWKGDIAGGAKALARGFAILAIELVFALLFNIGSVIKALKSGLKGTVKAATGAVKNAFKTTIKAARELGTVTKAAFKAGVKNARLVITGFRQGFGEGIRSLGQLTRELLAKSRFRGFMFKLKRGALELWARFNPWVFLGQHKLSKKDVEEWLEAIAGSGEKLAKATRADAEALAKATARDIAATGKLSKKTAGRVERFFQQFKSQHVGENPILAEAWDRALRRLEDSAEFKPFFQGKQLSDDVMKKLYKRARGNINQELETLVEEMEKTLNTTLTNRLAGLPERVEVHHIVYKAIDAQLAVTKSNLILALRKTGGAADELHDIFHLVSAAGTGNRWKNLPGAVKDLLEDIF